MSLQSNAQHCSYSQQERHFQYCTITVCMIECTIIIIIKISSAYYPTGARGRQLVYTNLHWLLGNGQELCSNVCVVYDVITVNQSVHCRYVDSDRNIGMN